jgi:antitoxin (DNA-binding transcriptional repressor) of toxin-antitoxin stability system
MKVTSIRELKHATSAVLAIVADGESVEVRRRNVPIAMISPIKPAKVRRRDFRGRLKAIYGDQILTFTGTDLMAEDRDNR